MTQTAQHNSPSSLGKITPQSTAEVDLVNQIRSQSPSDQKKYQLEVQAEIEQLSTPQLTLLLGIIRLCRSIAS